MAPTPTSTQASGSSPFCIATPVPAVSSVQPPPAKRAKTCTSDMDDIIESKRVGKYIRSCIGFSLLKASSCNHRVNGNSNGPSNATKGFTSLMRTRPHIYQERMISDPVGPGAVPLALLCLDKAVKEDFNSRHKAVYLYEVLGGLHTFLAKSQLSVELPDNEAFKRVHADVYVGLTDDEAMRPALRHNHVSHFSHKTTHRDLVCACQSVVCKQVAGFKSL